MADYDSNLIKPVDSLKNITGLKPVKHREERKRRRQSYHDSNEKDDETTQEQETPPEQKAGDESDINSESIGIDYCA
jgi:hypothetical protein